MAAAVAAAVEAPEEEGEAAAAAAAGVAAVRAVLQSHMARRLSSLARPALHRLAYLRVLGQPPAPTLTVVEVVSH